MEYWFILRLIQLQMKKSYIHDQIAIINGWTNIGPHDHKTATSTTIWERKQFFLDIREGGAGWQWVPEINPKFCDKLTFKLLWLIIPIPCTLGISAPENWSVCIYEDNRYLDCDFATIGSLIPSHLLHNFHRYQQNASHDQMMKFRSYGFRVISLGCVCRLTIWQKALACVFHDLQIARVAKPSRIPRCPQGVQLAACWWICILVFLKISPQASSFQHVVSNGSGW